MKLIISGPPGSGKGTRASRIAKALSLAHISTGDLFRKEIADGTELGKLAKGIMDQGKLVPDEVTMGMLKNRLKQEDCKKGFILDGVPRTINQAEMLKEITEIDYVINLDLPNEVIIERMGSRRTCKGCGAIFNVKTMPPKTEGKCDHCSAELIQREDEKPEIISKRLQVYDNQTKPLIEFYNIINLLRNIDGTLMVEDPNFWTQLKTVLKVSL